MRIDFSRKEICENYIKEMIDYMVHEENVHHNQAEHIIMNMKGFDMELYANLDDYEFTEPSKVADEFLEEFRSDVYYQINSLGITLEDIINNTELKLNE